MTFSLDLIKKELSSYVNFIEHERTELKLMSGRAVPSGTVVFKISLKEGITADSVPHTAEIGKMEALLTIPGRLPLCLNCSVLGHISKNCQLRFCQKCRQLKKREHVCDELGKNKSFAEIVKGHSHGEEFIGSEDWAAAFEEPREGAAIDKESELERNILDLENKIQLSKSAIFDKKVNLVSAVSTAEKVITLEEKGGVIKVQSEDDEESDDSEEFMNEEGTEGQSIESQMGDGSSTEVISGLKSNNKKKKNKKKESVVSKNSLKVIDKESLQFVTPIRSYGRPNLRNARRLNEDKAFQKISQKSPDYREFLFQD